MAVKRPHGYCFLDSVRLNKGTETCKAVFTDICNRDIKQAAFLLNDQRLTFPCLFVLLPQIESFHLDRYLSALKTAALEIVGSIGKPDGPSEATHLFRKKDALYPALKWILKTGHGDDGMSDEYEEILDITISVQISVYNDLDVLPVALDIIFSRNKRGHNIHNLVWAVFQARSPYVLKIIAQRSISSDSRDTELAYNLLGIEAPDEDIAAADKQKGYEAYLQWLRDNDPFLYFTGESLQYASRPVFYTVDLERKYIHKGIPSYNKQPIVPADDQERRALAAFNALGNEDKTLLSGYSQKLHNENPSNWKAWVRRPIDEQITFAKLTSGENHDYDIR